MNTIKKSELFDKVKNNIKKAMEMPLKETQFNISASIEDLKDLYLDDRLIKGLNDTTKIAPHTFYESYINHHKNFIAENIDILTEDNIDDFVHPMNISTKISVGEEYTKQSDMLIEVFIKQIMTNLNQEISYMSFYLNEKFGYEYYILPFKNLVFIDIFGPKEIKFISPITNEEVTTYEFIISMKFVMTIQDISINTFELVTDEEEIKKLMENN